MKDELVNRLTEIFTEEVLDAVVIEEMKGMHSDLSDDLTKGHSEYDTRLLEAVTVILKYYLSANDYAHWCKGN